MGMRGTHDHKKVCCHERCSRWTHAPSACAQVGNQTIDHLYWGRPEDITPTTYGARLVYVVDPTHPAADVVGAAAAALAATAQAGACDDKDFA